MTSTARQRNPWALSGVLFVALFLAALIYSSVSAGETYPSPFGPAAEIQRYFTEHRGTVQAFSLLQAIAAIALLGFAVALAASVRRAADEAGVLSGLTLGGGVLAAATLLLSASFSWVLARPATAEAPALVRALHDLAFLTGGPGHVPWFGVLIGAGSLAALRVRTLPGWIAWLGIAVAALSLLSVISMVVLPAAILLPLGRFLGFVWIVAVSLVLARGGRRVSEMQHD